MIIYPNYIDSKKKVSEGRRIPLDKGRGALLGWEGRKFSVAACCGILASCLCCQLAQQMSPIIFTSRLGAACDSPNVNEIADSCNIGLGLKAEYEVKPAPLPAIFILPMMPESSLVNF